MAVTWKLQGGTVSTATAIGTLGVSGAIRTRRSLAQDELSFLADGAALDAAALFAYGDEVVLTRTVDSGSPVTWFRGRCVHVQREGKGDGERIVYRIAGPWWYFENLVFQQIWPLDAAANSHLTSPTTYRRALAIVGMASSTGLRQNTKDFISDVLGYLIGSNSPAVASYTAGELPTGFDVPFTRLDAPTCAEALRWICRWIPDAAAWFDYSVSPPKINLQRRSGASTLSYALTSLSEVQVNPRPDLKIDNLLIQFVTLNDSGLVVLQEDKDPSGTTGKEWGSAVFTIDNNYLALPTGLAANYRAGLSVLQYAGQCVIEEEECSQAVHPGHLINITGGLSAWATMAAQVQEVVEELDSGRTAITFGPPAHIQLSDLVEILRIARNQSDHFGGSGEILKSGGKAKNQTLTVDIEPAAAMPTNAEIVAGIEEAYSGKPLPRVGDTIRVSVWGFPRFAVYVHSLNSTLENSGLFIADFTISSKHYYGHVFYAGWGRKLSVSMSPSGAIPVGAEIATALEAAYTGLYTPWDGDIVMITVGGVAKFKATFDSRFSANAGLFVVYFTRDSVNYFARVAQVGIY
jgi:hypothetical protein